jgi:hypothetical protein
VPPPALATAAAAPTTLAGVLADARNALGIQRRASAPMQRPATWTPNRFDELDDLPSGGTARFRELHDPITLVRILRTLPWLLEPLEDAAAALADRPGQARLKGRWVLPFLAFSHQNEANLQPWVHASARPSGPSAASRSRRRT